MRYTFWYISLTSYAKQRREVTKFKVFVANVSRAVIFVFFNLKAFPSNTVPESCGQIVQAEQVGTRGLSPSDGRRPRRTGTTKGMQKECNFHFMSRRRALARRPPNNHEVPVA